MQPNVRLVLCLPQHFRESNWRMRKQTGAPRRGMDFYFHPSRSVSNIAGVNEKPEKENVFCHKIAARTNDQIMARFLLLFYAVVQQDEMRNQDGLAGEGRNQQNF